MRNALSLMLLVCSLTQPENIALAWEDEVTHLKRRIDQLETENQALRAEVAKKLPDFRIVALHVKDFRRIGVQHRYPRVVLPNPTDKEQVEQVMRAVYTSYKRDIEETQPDAKYKRIGILLYDSAEDAEDHDGHHICFVESSGTAEETLPDWGKLKVSWNWRHPDARPTPRELLIYREYWRGFKETSRPADDAFDGPRETRVVIGDTTLESINAISKALRTSTEHAVETARQLSASGFGEIGEVTAPGGPLEQLLRFAGVTGMLARHEDPSVMVRAFGRLLLAQKKPRTAKNLRDLSRDLWLFYTTTSMEPNDIEPLSQEMAVLARLGIKQDEALVTFSIFVDAMNRRDAAFHTRSLVQRLAALGTPRAIDKERLAEWVNAFYAEEREKKAEIEVVTKLRSRYGMTKGELQIIIAYVHLWRLGEKPKSERINEWIDRFYGEWPD